MAMPDLRRVVAPAAWPSTFLDLARAQLRVSSPSQNDLIASYIKTAANQLDGKSGLLFHCLLPQTWEQYLDYRFPSCNNGQIVLPLGPVRSIDHIKYTDVYGVEQEVATSVYELLPADGLDDAVIELKWQQSWPVVQHKRRAITITYQAGYADADAVPADIKSAMLLHITHLYENRSAVNVGNITSKLPMSYDNLINNLKRDRV